MLNSILIVPNHGRKILAKIITSDMLLMNAHPELYEELHIPRNKESGIDITRISRGSSKKVWWKCRINPTHYWYASVANRSGFRKDGCTMCSGRFVVFGVNDLSITDPEIYEELHISKNKEEIIDIQTLKPTSKKEVWWKCRENPSHYWRAAVLGRTSCAMCRGAYVVHGINDLSVTNPEFYAKLNFSKNQEIGLDSKTISVKSGKDIWWQCDKNPKHFWKAPIRTVNGQKHVSCTMCSGFFVVHGINDLSVLRPELYRELHIEKNAENGIDTSKLSPGTQIRVWWQCSKNPKHFWNSPVNDRTRPRNHGCGMCTGMFVVHGINDLSVVRPDLYSELHIPKNEAAGIDYTRLSWSSGKKAWWQCKLDNRHIWIARVSHRSGITKSSGCAMCSSKILVHGVNDLLGLRPDLYSELHVAKNFEAGIDITQLAVSSDRKVWWQCKKDPEHFWATQIGNRSHTGTGCPHCSIYVNEAEFRASFNKNSNFVFEDGRVYGKRVLFIKDTIQIDMLNYDNKIVIEYDGYFSHGENKYHKKTGEERLERDVDTTIALLGEGYKVIRIRETPLQKVPIKDPNLFQISFRAGADRTLTVIKCVMALQKMGVDIELQQDTVESASS